jgi:hypothetical protein
MLDLLCDLWGLMRERKKYWLAPVIVILVLIGIMIIISQATAPFIYTLF